MCVYITNLRAPGVSMRISRLAIGFCPHICRRCGDKRAGGCGLRDAAAVFFPWDGVFGLSNCWAIDEFSVNSIVMLLTYESHEKFSSTIPRKRRFIL